MEGFSYTDIFATKGIEYLVVITFLSLLIPFWLLLNRESKFIRKIGKVLEKLTFSNLKIPQGLFYSKNHTWMFMEKTGVAKMGLDDLLLHITGEVNTANLKNPGDVIRRGELLAEISRNNKRLQILSPLTGRIIAGNNLLSENPGLVNEDPYGNGWIYRIEPFNWMEEVKLCYFAKDATNWSKGELERFRDFMAGTMNKLSPETSMIVLQDGGELLDHPLNELPEQIWKDFENEFLILRSDPQPHED